jgi:N-methylhydantoinase A
MDIGEVHVPVRGGVFSSVGLLLADLRVDTLRSVARQTADLDPEYIGTTFTQLEHEAREQLVAQGVEAGDVRCERLADVRYAFQVATETVELTADELSGDVGKAVAERFTRHFEGRYGYTAPDPVVLVNVRVRATAPAGRLELGGLAGAAASDGGRLPSHRAAYFGGAERVETVTYPVGLLPDSCTGPAVVELSDTTIVIPPGWSARRRADMGTYVLRRESTATGTVIP